MKKTVCLLITVILAVLALSACGAETPAPAAETEAVTAEDGEVVTTVKERGLRFVIDQAYIDRGLCLEMPNENLNGYRMIQINYYSPTALRLLDEVIDMDSALRTPEVAQDYTERIWATTRCLLEIALIETEEYKSLLASGGHDENVTNFAPARYFGENEGYTYILSLPELDDGDLTAEEAEEYHAMKAYMPTLVEKISFVDDMEFENYETVLEDYMPAFTTQDLSGNEITAEIFREKSLTVVNVWGTFCGPCIEEMPALADWARKMDERVQLIGIVGDIEGLEDAEHLELARLIAEKAGIEFTNLIPTEDFSVLMNGLIGFPTTFFVDESGAIVGEPIIGANVEAYMAFVDSYLSGLER